MSEILMSLSMLGFLAANALETALLTLSFSDERKLVHRLSGRGDWRKRLSVFYQGAFERWRRHPAHFLSLVLVINSAFSGLWCVISLSKWGATVGAGFLTAMALFLAGELIPKVLARRFPEKSVMFLLPPFYACFKILEGLFLPAVHVIEKFSQWPQRLGLTYPLTEKEIKSLLSDREMTVDLKPRSRLVLESIFNFSSRRVREAMRPAKEVFVLNAQNGQLSEVLAMVAQHPYSRIPVSRDGTLDETIGILYVKDLLFAFATSGLLHLQDLLRECPVVQDTDRLGLVMETFRRGGIHLALVKDKSGRVKGLISLEDILEEIVGDIQDEYQ